MVSLEAQQLRQSNDFPGNYADRKPSVLLTAYFTVGSVCSVNVFFKVFEHWTLT